MPCGRAYKVLQENNKVSVWNGSFVYYYYIIIYYIIVILYHYYIIINKFIILFINLYYHYLYYSNYLFFMLEKQCRKMLIMNSRKTLWIRVGNFGDGLKKMRTLYPSYNIVNCIEPPQIAGSRDQFEFHHIWLNDHLLLHKVLVIFYFNFDCSTR